MSYTTEEKIEYFRNEKIPSIQASIKSIQDTTEDKSVLKKNRYYNSLLENLVWAEKRLEQLTREHEYKTVIGNKPTTTLTIDRKTLFLICAEKTLEFEVTASNYINTKFRSGKAEFESIDLITDGLSLRAKIQNPTIKREKELGIYRISFELKTYTASKPTVRNINKLKIDNIYVYE